MSRLWSLLCLCSLSRLCLAFNVLGLYGSDGDAAHNNFAQEAQPWLSQHASANGFSYHGTKNFGDINTSNLKNYQVVMFLDGSSNGLDDSQQKAIQQFVESGGGLMVFHSANYNEKGWNFQWLHNTMLGTGPFNRNTWWPTKIHYRIDSPNHPAMKGLPNKFESSVSEWYAWENDLRKNPDIEILASIDDSSFPVGTDCPDQCWYSGYFPLIWTNRKHKVMYVNFGHNYMDYAKNQGKSSTFSSNDQNKFLFQALHWLAGN